LGGICWSVSGRDSANDWLGGGKRET